MGSKRMMPAARPAQSKNWALRQARAFDLRDPVFLLGVRGYFLDTMGEPGVNSRGIYDDAIFVVERGTQGIFKAYNANTDPSVFRKGIAVLEPGMYLYRKGIHGISGKHPHQALRQASPVRVKRDGSESVVQDKAPNFFWINIHCGSINSTSSEGCQTIQPSQWFEFRAVVYELMDQHRMELIPYVLIETQG